MSFDWFSQVMWLVTLFFVLGIWIHTLMQPTSDLAQRSLIAPLKETAGSLGTLEVEAQVVFDRLGHGENERFVAVATHHARIVSVLTSSVTGMQGGGDALQIRIHLVSSRGHKTFGEIRDGLTTVITPWRALAGGDLIVL